MIKNALSLISNELKNMEGLFMTTNRFCEITHELQHLSKLSEQCAELILLSMQNTMSNAVSAILTVKVF
mgnify:CR=1 FL=1